MTYAALGDVAARRDAVFALLTERHDDLERWRARGQRGIARAADFSWSQYATAVASLYAHVATRAAAAGSRAGEPERSRASV